MRAVVCRELGPLSEGLHVEQRPEPEAGPGQVVVEVEAAGANFVDGLTALGQYQMRPPVPYVPGGEVAGQVGQIGAGVTSVGPGDRVAALCGFGGFAERLAVHEMSIVHVPDGLGSGVAATFVQSYCTAHFALVTRGRLQPDETVLVLGGGGGVGLATVDVAHHLGARVLATGSTPQKRSLATAAGADVVFDPDERLKERVREATDGGADLVLDPVGGDLAEGALRSLREGGRYLVVGFTSGTIPRLPLNQVLLRNRMVVGVDWGAWAFRHVEEQRSLAQDLMRRAAQGALHPVEPAQRPLDDAAPVLEDFLARRAVGKVVLIP